MKKTIAAIIILFSSLAANAQTPPFNSDRLIDMSVVRDILNICGILLVIYVISSFILQVIKYNFDFRIKSKIIDKGIEEHIVSQLVQPNKKDPRHTALQWFFVLAGIAVGFTIMNYTQPYGLHSLAIMGFSVAAGFGGYYYFTRRSDK